MSYPEIPLYGDVKSLETCDECGGDLSADCHQETMETNGYTRGEVSDVGEEFTTQRSVWMVTKPKQNSVKEDILFKVFTHRLGYQFLGGLTPEELIFVGADKDAAATIAEALLAERDSVPICEHCGHRAILETKDGPTL